VSRGATLRLALAALAATAWQAPAEQAASGPAERVLVLAKDARPPEEFLRVVEAFQKELPDGHRVKVVIRPQFDLNIGAFRDALASLTAVDADGTPDGEELHFAAQEHGPVRRANYRKGVQHGLETFYRTGPDYRPLAWKTVPWEDGRVHGAVKLLYPDGKVMSETPYVRGVLEGESRSYAPDGFVTRVVHYKAGQRDGELIEHWPRTRKIKQTVPYRMGKVHGTVRQYYESGQLKREVQVWEDCFHGVDRQYYEDGELRKTTWWVLDEEVSEAEFAQRYRLPPDTQPTSRPATRPAAAGEDK